MSHQINLNDYRGNQDVLPEALERMARGEVVTIEPVEGWYIATYERGNQDQMKKAYLALDEAKKDNQITEGKRMQFVLGLFNDGFEDITSQDRASIRRASSLIRRVQNEASTNSS